MPPTALTRFVRLPENRSALAACQDLLLSLSTDQANGTPNPLFLHGPPGAGKSYLLTALADELAAGGAEVCRLSANDFGRENDGGAARCADLTIIEDVQHLPRSAVPALIALIDQRLGQGAPMIFTALDGPANVRLRGQRWPARLTSRLAGGLVIGLTPPQAASRRRLLSTMSERAKLKVDAEILDWLAERLIGGGRQLEGAVRQLKSLQALQAKPLRLADIRAHFRAPADAAEPTVQRIARHVCGYYRIKPKLVQSQGRSRDIVLPRQVSMYLARQLTGQSLERIGRYFGGRDHKTVQHACRKVESALKRDAKLSGAVRQLQAELA